MLYNRAMRSDLTDLIHRLCCLERKISRLNSTIINNITNITGGGSYVWRPGAPTSGNVFGTFAALYAALSLVDGLKLVAVDTSLAPAIVPPGIYNMLGVTLVGLEDTVGQTLVTLSDGAQFVDLRSTDHFLRIETQTTGAAQMVWTPPGGGIPAFFSLGVGSTLVATTSTPPIQLVANEPMVIVAFDGGTVGDGVLPVVSIPNNGFLSVTGLDFAILSDNLATGPVGAGLQIQYLDSTQIPAVLTGFLDTPLYSAVPPVPGGVVYVSATNGSDTQGNGSSRRPYQSIQKALNDFVSADTIRVFPGTYAEFVIPTNPPRARLTIEGVDGGEQDTGGVIVQNLSGGDAVTLMPSPADANGIHALTLRKLKLRTAGLACGLMAADFGPANNDFLDEGVLVDECECNDNAYGICTYKAGRVFLRNLNSSDLLIEQVGEGRFDNVQNKNLITLTVNTTLPMPNIGRGTLRIYNSNFNDFDFEANPSIYVDPSSVVIRFFGGVLIDDGGVGPSIVHEGHSNEFDASLPTPTGTPHTWEFDRAKIKKLTLSINPGTRATVSAKNGTFSQVSVGGPIDLSLRGSTYDPALLAVAGGATVDEDVKMFVGVVGVAPGAQPIPIPYPASVGPLDYGVTPEVGVLATVAISAKSSTDFTAQASAVATVNFVLTRRLVAQ